MLNFIENNPIITCFILTLFCFTMMMIIALITQCVDKYVAHKYPNTLDPINNKIKKGKYEILPGINSK